MIIVNVAKQTLEFKGKIYPCSTAKNGIGEVENSFKTPKGLHKICAKIGENLPKYTIFKGRKNIGIWNGKRTTEDLILSRILWLDGIEDFNQNSKQRYIYIHATNDEKNLGSPNSMGCIRMQSDDIIELFDLVVVGDLVKIL